MRGILGDLSTSQLHAGIAKDDERDEAVMACATPPKGLQGSREQVDVGFSIKVMRFDTKAEAEDELKEPTSAASVPTFYRLSPRSWGSTEDQRRLVRSLSFLFHQPWVSPQGRAPIALILMFLQKKAGGLLRDDQQAQASTDR
jgi:hypothetical protein